MIIHEIAVKNYITKTRIPAGDYVINPYVGCPHRCIYCYADYMRRFTNHSEKWGDFLDVKRCDKKINTSALNDKKVVFCSVTDAYNPYEKKFRVTRSILENFVDTPVKVEILTKSALILRDADLFGRIPNIRAGISLNTLDDAVRKKLEPGASPVDKRINAIRRLTEMGIDTYIFLSPIFPGITDFKAILSECKTYTQMFYFENLNLRGAFRPVVMRYISENYPQLLPLYDEIYKKHNYSYWHDMEDAIDAFCTENNIRWGSYFYHEKIRR